MHSLLQIFPLICSIWCCWKTTLLLPISTFCILPFKVWVLPRICPCSSMQVFWHIFLTFCWDRLFLSFEDVNLEYQTSFLDYSFLHDLIPWNFFFSDKALKRPQISLLKSRVVTFLFALLLALRIPNIVISWTLQPVLLCQMGQDVAIEYFQEPPRLFMPCCAVSPALE